VTRKLLPKRRGDKPPFLAGHSPPPVTAFPRGRLLILGIGLVLAVSMLFVTRARMQSEARVRELAATESQPLVEDRTELLAGLFQGALRDAIDGTDFEETDSYDRLIYHVRAMPEAEFAAQVTRRLDWADAVARPGMWRGEFVRFRGLVASLEAVKLRHAGDGPEDIYRGFVAQPDSSEMVAFDYVGVPPLVDARRDVIDIEGVVYRTVRYESKTGEVREVPYLIVRSLEVYRGASEAQSPWLGWKLLVAVLASLVVALLFLRWSSRRRGPPTAPPVGRPGLGETS